MSDAELAREILNVPGFTHHWIPEHYEAAFLHAQSVLACVWLAMLREMAAEECPACKDGKELFRDEESGEWAHERPGLPNFLCEAPEIIAERIVALEQAAGGSAAGRQK